jgi:hypothetical protein
MSRWFPSRADKLDDAELRRLSDAALPAGVRGRAECVMSGAPPAGTGAPAPRSRIHAWSEGDIATLVRMARACHSDPEIGRRLGLSAAAVGRKRRALGIAGGTPPRLRIVMARRALNAL